MSDTVVASVGVDEEFPADGGERQAAGPVAVEFPELGGAAAGAVGRGGLLPVMDLMLPCYFELGGARLSVADLLGLQRGSVVTLDRLIGEAGTLVVAGKPFASAEVVTLEGGYYGVRVTQVFSRSGVSARDLLG